MTSRMFKRNVRLFFSSAVRASKGKNTEIGTKLKEQLECRIFIKFFLIGSVFNLKLS